MKTFGGLLQLTIVFSFFVFLPMGLSESPTQKFKTEQEIVRVQMIQLSRELGVSCTDCHSQKNWKDNSKQNFKTALKHLKIVDVLKSQGFDGKTGPAASCFMCHQGRLKFVHKMQHPEGAAEAH